LPESRLITSTEEIERSQNAALALTTYTNYVSAWVTLLNKQYGIGDEGKVAFKITLSEIPNVRSIRGRVHISDELTTAYCRGHLLLRAMQALPIQSNPQLARLANFWLPVQSYYAIHGLGLATMIALNISPPRNHNAFRGSFHTIVKDYFPSPFNGLCSGGPDKRDFVFTDLSTDADRVTQLIQLTSPTHVEDLDTFVGKSLSTTRQEFLNKRYIERRKQEKRRNLSRESKIQCCRNEHPTSICDFLYRLRVRSNYDNPDMHLFASIEDESSCNSYTELVYLIELLFIGLNVLVENSIGRRNTENLRRELDSTSL
jgi:hypothetical protein